MRFTILFLSILMLGCNEKVSKAKSCSSARPLFQFAQMSDPHVGKGHNEKLTQAIKILNRLSIDFVIVSGDLTEDGKTSEYLKFNKMMRDLDAPYIALPGNHDVTGPTYEERVTKYESLVGPANQVFQHKGFAFVLLENNYRMPGYGQPMHLEEWQYEFVEDVLREGLPTFVFGHIQGTKNGQPQGEHGIRLAELLLNYDNALGYFHGHVHKGMMKVINNKMFFGASSILGRIRENDHPSNGIGVGQVVLHKIFENEIEACMVSLDGAYPHNIYSHEY